MKIFIYIKSIIINLVLFYLTPLSAENQNIITMSSKPSEVIVVGSTVIDFVAYTNTLPLKGETVIGSRFSKNYGGKGANQAVQCARLGIETSMCGAVGDDFMGEDYLAQLQVENVNTNYMSKNNMQSTGIANINVETSTGSNTIVIIPGANEGITFDTEKESSKELITHIKQSKVLICQNEIPIKATLTALQIAQSFRTISIFNPAPASIELLELISHCDIICPNESELSTLSSLPTRTNDEILKAAKYLLSHGCKVVCVTLGDKGALIVTKLTHLFVPSERVVAVDTTGAGDSFIGTLASNLARGCNIEKSVKNAIHCATLSVTKDGAQKSYSRLKDILEEYKPPVYCDILYDKDSILLL